MTTFPKEAWKFKAWTNAMLQGAQVGTPEYKAKGLGTKQSSTRQRKKRKRRRRKRAKKE